MVKCRVLLQWEGYTLTAEQITSRQNSLIQQIRQLAVSRALRKRTELCLCDGEKLLREAITARIPIETVLFTGRQPQNLPEGVRLVQVDAALMEYVSPMDTPPGLLFLAKMAEEELPDHLDGDCYLVLDGVQDPGNVGTIIRTADAFGCDAVILVNGCADHCSPKTIRASMGAVFRLPVYRTDTEILLRRLQQDGILLYGAALRGDTQDIRSMTARRRALALGSEGSGLTEKILQYCAGTVRIPMRERCESLNVATAAAVLLWETYRDR